MVQLPFSDMVEKTESKAACLFVECGMSKDDAVRKAVELTAGDRSRGFQEDLYSVLEERLP